MPTLNMVPMIDVVFQLLIFFMCTSAFVVEKELNSQLPGSSRNAKPADFSPVRIKLTSFGAGVQITCDRLPLGDFKALATTLVERQKLGDMPVIIEGEGSVPFRYMVAALDACHQAKLRRVAFSTRGGAPPAPAKPPAPAPAPAPGGP
jgi:biopolymer transport protein ExbD